MKFAFILDPLEVLKIHKDSSYAMMVEAQSREHDVFVMEQKDIALLEGRVTGRVSRITLQSDSADWHILDEPEITPLSAFDAVIMRKDPPFDIEYVTTTWMLELAQKQGACVINDPRALRDHNEKFAITEFPGFMVPTLVARDEILIRDFIAAQGDVILKPLDGMGGSSIFRVHPNEPNLSVILENLTAFGARTIMAQRFIPEIADGDKRVLVIKGEPVPYCLARIPMAGETRGNLAAGGTGVARPLTPRDREIAEAVGRELAPRGLVLIGLDIIGNYLTEINVTSPTCFQEIMRQSDFNVAGFFIDAVESIAASLRPDSRSNPHPDSR